MTNKLVSMISILLMVVHVVILYFWIFDWEKLITEVGLVSWIGSIFLGFILYLVYRRKVVTEKGTTVSVRVVFTTTIMTGLLGVFAVLIEWTTSSMP